MIKEKDFFSEDIAFLKYRLGCLISRTYKKEEFFQFERILFYMIFRSCFILFRFLKTGMN